MSRATPNLHEANWANDSTRKHEPLYTITQYIVSSLRAFYLDSTAMMYTVVATYPRNYPLLKINNDFSIGH